MKYTSIYLGESSMVSHKRLQHYKRYYGKTCMTGIYGCRWHRYQQSRDSTSLWDVGWFCLLILLLLFMLTWLLYWVAAYNDDTHINEIVLETFGSQYYDWHRVFLAVTSATFAYVAILFIFALLHASYGHELYLHYVHKFILLLVLTGCILIAYFASKLWVDGWSLLYLSILGNWPFIHLTIVTVMTLLTLLIAKRWHYLYSLGARVAWLPLFIAVILFIYLSPLLVEPPCVIDPNNKPQPPLLIAHRGGAALGPENTLLAFQWASRYPRVFAFECDIQLSLDGVPFLMRDQTLSRTTNVSVAFPGLSDSPATSFNITELQALNAGQWFLDADPFHVGSRLSGEERGNISRQTVPTLEEVVSFVKTTNKSLLLHILPSDVRPADQVLQLIHQVIMSTGIPPKRILWANSTHFLNTTVPYTHVLSRAERNIDVLNASYQLINLPYRATDFDLFNMYQSPEMNLSVNLYTVNSRWLYSVYWCAGISSVTTNDVHALSTLTEPLWVMDHLVYLILWVVVDVVSACVIVGIFIYHRVKKSGVMFNPETLSLQAMQHRLHQNRQNRTMKEKLLYTAESIQDMDAIMLRIDSPSSPPTPATPATLDTPTTPISPLTPNSVHGNGVLPANSSLPHDGNISYSRASGFFGESLMPRNARKENGIHPDPPLDKNRNSGVFDDIVTSKGGHENRASGFFDEALSNVETGDKPNAPNGYVQSIGEDKSENSHSRNRSLNTEIQKFFEGTSLPQTVLDRFEKAAEEAEEKRKEEEEVSESVGSEVKPVVMVNGYHSDSEPGDHTSDAPTSITIETASQEQNTTQGPSNVSDVNVD